MPTSFQMIRGGSGVLAPPARAAKRPRSGVPGAPPRDGAGDGDGGGDGDGSGAFGGADDIGPFALGLALAGISTLFLVLIAVWLFLRRPAPDWPLPGPAAAVRALWLSTACLVSSGVAVELAARRARGTERRATLRWLCASLLLGLAFLGAQTHLWLALWNAGLVPASSGYAAVFFALTGLHALHVLGGLGFLGATTLALRRAKAHVRRAQSVRLGAVYWHFMGAIWLVLFTLLYFVR